ncbi:selenocysteine-tRNA-specific elongation factor [Trypanosoma cruzi]|nr:selenocysteine-tRNA-specific elongation factor [Trypanosoma cruzi]
MKKIRVSLNLSSTLGSHEFGMKASLEFYLKSGAHAISGTEGTLTPESPLAFLVLWMRALQLHREPKKQFMDLGRIVLQVFRMQIVIKFDPSIPIQKLRARLRTAFHEDDTFARVAQPFMDRRGTRSQQQRSLLCQLCLIYGHDASTCKVRPKRVFPNYKRKLKNGRRAAARRSLMLATAVTPNPPPPAIPHRHRTAPPTLHPIVQTADGIDEEGGRDGSRDVGAVNVGAENVPGGAIHNLSPHARTADQRGELCGLFDDNRSGAIDLTAVRQDAAVHVGNGTNSAGHGGFEVTKNCGAIGDEAGAPLNRGRDESSNPQPDRLEGTCCFSTCVDNGESLVRDCGLNSQQFHTGA